MDIPAMFRRAVAEFDARVRQIGGHQAVLASGYISAQDFDRIVNPPP